MYVALAGGKQSLGGRMDGQIRCFSSLTLEQMY